MILRIFINVRINDNRSYTKKALAQLLRKDYERVREMYPRQEMAITKYLRRLERAEKCREQNVDAVAGLTGDDSRIFIAAA